LSNLNGASVPAAAIVPRLQNALQLAAMQQVLIVQGSRGFWFESTTLENLISENGNNRLDVDAFLFHPLGN
jgi:hypothetical protein